MARTECLCHWRAACCLRTEDHIRLVLHEPELDQFAEALVDLGQLRSGSDGNDDLIGKPPAKLLSGGVLDPEAETVVINSGDGLKTPDAVAERVGPKITIPPRYEAFIDFWKDRNS